MAGIAPDDVDEPWRPGGRPADRMDERKALLDEIVADDGAHLGAVATGQRARGLFQLGRAHVVRRRVDEVAREADAVDDAGQVFTVDIAGQLDLEVFVLLLAVAGETVAAERKGQGRQLRIVGRVCESVGTRR